MRILETKKIELQTAIRQAPLLPGCYLYKDDTGKIIYIGKAKILRNRLRSYFNNHDRLQEKIRQMVELADSVDTITTDSEVEALLLESNLIKKYKPKYNSMLVDDKSYIYVGFSPISSAQGANPQTVPTIFLSRTKEIKGATYFGPYPDSRLVKRLLRRLRRLFPYCSSNVKLTIPRRLDQKIITSNDRPCFHYQVALCPGTCVGKVTRGEMEDNLYNIKVFFEGDKPQLVRAFTSKMKAAAAAQDYEEAAKFRNMLRDIQYVGSNLHIDKDTDEVAVVAEKKQRKTLALERLITGLEFPQNKLKNHPGFRMECYDISNIQGKFAVGSMVVFIDGDPEPSLYRRFKIRLFNEPNDFAMLQEMLTRRFNQYLRARLFAGEENRELVTEFTDNEGFTVEIPAELKTKLKNWKPDPSFSQKPDLIIIDGGKGQLSATYQILGSFALADNIPIIGLAKREEEIFKVTTQFANRWMLHEDTPTMATDFTRVKLAKRDEALYLMQRIRDEAHRFAITYHRKLRSKLSI